VVLRCTLSALEPELRLLSKPKCKKQLMLMTAAKKPMQKAKETELKWKKETETENKDAALSFGAKMRIKSRLRKREVFSNASELIVLHSVGH